MPTDWERSQLAAIERGLAEDLRMRRRAGRRVRPAGWKGVVAAFTLLICIGMSSSLGFWWGVVALPLAYALALGGRARGGRRRGL